MSERLSSAWSGAPQANSTEGTHQNCRPSCGCRLQRYTARRLRSLFFILLSGTPADKCGGGGPSGRRRSPRRYETSRSLSLGPVFGRKHTRTATLARLLETETEAEEAGAVTADRQSMGEPRHPLDVRLPRVTLRRRSGPWGETQNTRVRLD